MKKLVMFCAFSCVAGVGLVYFDRMSAGDAKGNVASALGQVKKNYQAPQELKSGGVYKIGELLAFIRKNPSNKVSNFIMHKPNGVETVGCGVTWSEGDMDKEVKLQGSGANRAGKPLLFFVWTVVDAKGNSGVKNLYIYDPNEAARTISAKSRPN